MRKTTIINVGDRVAFAAKFLRSIGDYTYDTAQRRGTVIAITKGTGWELARIRWDHGVEQSVNPRNLIRADHIHLEPA
jgi:hypothetical protein